MNIVDIIDKKRRKIELSEEEIKYVINGFLEGEVKDYQKTKETRRLWTF